MGYQREKKMKINRNNYEAYFIDYLEDNLDKNIVDDFIEFLQQNPKLKEELSVLGRISVVPENISFNKKSNLYKEKLDSEKEFNQAAIATLEGDILATDKSEFENYIANHPDKKRDVILFGKTKLQPDETIIFKNKKKLYHRSKAKIVFLWTSRIAAVLILAFAFFALFKNNTNTVLPENNIAKVEKNVLQKHTPALIEKQIVSKKTEIETKTVEIKKVTPEPQNRVTQPIKKNNNFSSSKTEKQPVKTTTRAPMEIPPKINAITASINIKQPSIKLAEMKITIPDNADFYSDKELLIAKIKKKTGLDNFKFNDITKAGLSLISAVSKKKFRYETNEEGKITKYNYESRLLAFSIPSKKE
jgi:hypothetical protein